MDIIPAGALDKYSKAAVSVGVATDSTITVGTSAAAFSSIADNLRSRSVELKTYFTPKSLKTRSKTRPTSTSQVIVPISSIRSSTPTTTSDEAKKKSDKALGKGSGGKKGKGKRSKGGISTEEYSGARERE